MAEDAAGGRGGRPPRPPRPAIALPTRSTLESISSPGPMTLVSSFFADDPDSECRSFSQLLAGTTSPPAATAPHRRAEEGWVEGGAGRMEQSRPAGLVVAPSPFFTVPPGFSPAGLLESPGFFMPGLMGSMLGHVDLSHQQPLAQVTAQAAQSNSRMHIQPESSSVLKGTAASWAKPTDFAIPMVPNQHRPLLTSDTRGIAQENLEDHSDQRSQPLAPIVDKPADDGYNWRKYGQKQVKGSEYPRSYYKCTHLSCPVKKKVERTLDGQVTAIIYKGRHNHQRPLPNKRAKESGAFQSVINELNENTELDSQAHQESSVGPSISKRNRESGYGTPEQLSGSSDGEEMDGPERMADEADDSEPDPKRRNIENQMIESTSHRTVTEPRIIVQTTSEVDLLDDGYRWRKYGQKVVKGNPYPRSYYKCTNGGCNVRKHVERASTDPKSVLTTYEGRHNHAVPTAKNSSHNSANIHRGTDARYNEQQPAALQLKEEHEIT